MFATLPQARKFIEPKQFREIHKMALKAVDELKSKEAQMIQVLQKVDASKTYRYLGYNSLFQYCVKALLLSEAQAYNFITVARKAVECPDLQKAIEDKEITVCKARKITPVLTAVNQQQWLTYAKRLSKSELERRVAKVNPKVSKPESKRFLSDHILQLSVNMDEKVFEKLKRVQDLLCQKNRGHVTYEQALEKLCDLYLDKHDPVVKAKRSLSKNLSQDRKPKYVASDSKVYKKDNSRPAIPNSVKHRVHLRDGHRCRFIATDGQRCEEQRYLELHHKRPVSEGGDNSVSNLMTLCSGHHKMLHEF